MKNNTYCIANWKMCLGKKESIEYMKKISTFDLSINSAQIIICPSFVCLDSIINRDKNLGEIQFGVQNISQYDKGSYTGEVSISQIKDVGLTHALVGHSERRTFFNESDDFLKQKVDAALKETIQVIFCCGEPLNIRENENPETFVKNQLEASLFHLSSEEIKNCMIAYEPIWAIGTGKVANEEQISQMHTAIRKQLILHYDVDTANEISILYGGSCKPSNARAIFACDNVDGGLIGGASLEADSFVKLADCF